MSCCELPIQFSRNGVCCSAISWRPQAASSLRVGPGNGLAAKRQAWHPIRPTLSFHPVPEPAEAAFIVSLASLRVLELWEQEH